MVGHMVADVAQIFVEWLVMVIIPRRLARLSPIGLW